MNLKIQYSIKLGGMAQMVSVRIRRQILAVFGKPILFHYTASKKGEIPKIIFSAICSSSHL
jgi:hypothetical protein